MINCSKLVSLVYGKWCKEHMSILFLKCLVRNSCCFKGR